MSQIIASLILMLKALSIKSIKPKKSRVKIGKNGRDELDSRAKLNGRAKLNCRDEVGNVRFDSKEIRDNKIAKEKNYQKNPKNV